MVITTNGSKVIEQKFFKPHKKNKLMWVYFSQRIKCQSPVVAASHCSYSKPLVGLDIIWISAISAMFIKESDVNMLVVFMVSYQRRSNRILYFERLPCFRLSKGYVCMNELTVIFYKDLVDIITNI